jgi:hypothetical protein
MGGDSMQSYAPDDLTGLFTAPPQGPGSPMTYRQGVITAWNPVTLANTVEVGGKAFYDLPVLGVGEAASFAPGVAVGIASVGTEWAIVGRFVRPNTQSATDAITLIGQRMLTALVSTQESTTSSTYTDLATVGPMLSGVAVPASGKIYVFLSSLIFGDQGGSMSVEVSGDVSIAASAVQALLVQKDAPTTQISLAASRGVLFQGLPAGGSVNFTAKYNSLAGPGVPCNFRDRTMVAQQL